MFHLHVMGATQQSWLSSYDGNNYSNGVMGKWFLQYKTDIKIYLLFVNHPIHPV